MGLGLVLAMLCGAGVWWLAHPAKPATLHEVPAAPLSAGTASPSATAEPINPWDLLAAAERAASANAPSLPNVKPNMSEADWLAYDKQWCGAMQPLRERLQSTKAVEPELLSM